MLGCAAMPPPRELDAAGHLRLARLETEVLAEQWQTELWKRSAVHAAHSGQATAADPVTDRLDLVTYVRALLLPGEFLHAILDLKGRGLGFAAVTARRVLL